MLLFRYPTILAVILGSLLGIAAVVASLDLFLEHEMRRLELGVYTRCIGLECAGLNNDPGLAEEELDTAAPVENQDGKL